MLMIDHDIGIKKEVDLGLRHASMRMMRRAIQLGITVEGRTVFGGRVVVKVAIESGD